LETKKSKINDNKGNEKKEIDSNNNNTHPSQYTFDSSDAKEIMTGVGGDEGSAYPDSDKHIVEDIKKVIKEEKTELGEEGYAKSDSEQSNNKDENN
jgi:hypothetical protein